jgi:hypothetical protein
MIKSRRMVEGYVEEKMNYWRVLVGNPERKGQHHTPDHTHSLTHSMEQSPS